MGGDARHLAQQPIELAAYCTAAYRLDVVSNYAGPAGTPALWSCLRVDIREGSLGKLETGVGSQPGTAPRRVSVGRLALDVIVDLAVRPCLGETAFMA